MISVVIFISILILNSIPISLFYIVVEKHPSHTVSYAIVNLMDFFFIENCVTSNHVDPIMPINKHRIYHYTMKMFKQMIPTKSDNIEMDILN